MLRCLAVIALLSGCDGVFGLQKLHATDADDESGDASSMAVTFVAEGHRHANVTTATLTYPLAIADLPGRVLLLYVAAGSSCPPGVLTLATVSSFTFDGTPATQLDRIQGTPCSSAASSSELWMLVDPPAGTFDVSLTLSTTVPSLHSAALLFSNVDLSTPIRGCEHDLGRSASAIVTVASSPDDLVVSLVGQGTGITGPSAGTPLFLDNVNDFTTLNNSSASTLPGAPTVDAPWLFKNADEWQVIACSLRSAAP